MNTKKIFESSKGITLVELLLSLSLIGVVSVLIVGVLVSGMNSYKSVNKQISLHDEANAIMTRFSNEIFIATKIKQVSPYIINITKYGAEGETKLAFENGKATINDIPIHSDTVTIALNNSSMQVHDDTVYIELVVKNKETGERLALKNEVSFVNVEKE